MPSQANILSIDVARKATSQGRRPAHVRRSAPSWYSASAYGEGSSVTTRSDVFARDSSASIHRNAEAEAEAYLRKHNAAEEDAPHTPWGKLAQKAGAARKARVKEKAGERYFKQYEAGKPSDGSQSGPRAAVYKGEMGSTQRRSARMQQQGTPEHRAGRFSAPSQAPRKPWYAKRGFMAAAAVLVCIAFTISFLYAPFKQLYVDTREKDRLTAEYNAIVERNQKLEESVATLQTDAGIEDAARTQLGWVKSDERSIAVTGLDLSSDESSFQGNIVSDDIAYPETWYSSVLDPLFGVS